MKPFRWLLSVLVLLALLGSAEAGQEGKKGKRDAGIRGVVEKVDIQGKTITVKTGKKKDASATSVTVTVTDQTKFFIHGAEGRKEVSLTAVIPGQRVRIVKETTDSKEVATTVTILEKKKKNKG